MRLTLSCQANFEDKGMKEGEQQLNSDQIRTNAKIKMANINFRAYVHSCDELQPLRGGDGQIAVVSAIDPNGYGNFQPNFKVTPDQIRDFNNFKFFLSVGGYSFNLNPDYVAAAVHSLTNIIIGNGFNGIDFYYRQIPVDPLQFVDVLQKLIRNLKDKIPNLEVSITVPPGLSDVSYRPLFQACRNVIDYVIYQTYLLEDPVNNVGQLVQIFGDLPYPADKLFAGHSVFNTDWNTVPLLVFIAACPVLLNRGLISGISEWAASGV